MGVINVTPDSFADGGLHFDAERAIEHGLRMVADGADILDVGGESTRPGAEALDAAEELRRVLPVVERLASAGAQVSVDTYKAIVAREAVARGAVHRQRHQRARSSTASSALSWPGPARRWSLMHNRGRSDGHGSPC